MDGKSNILFEYQPTRNGDHAAKFLGDYSGYVVCDGCDAYNKLKKAVRYGCWAHGRRKFVDALPDDKDLLPASAAAKGVEYCNQLFLLERKYSGVDENGEQTSESFSDKLRCDRDIYETAAGGKWNLTGNSGCGGRDQ